MIYTIDDIEDLSEDDILDKIKELSEDISLSITSLRFEGSLRTFSSATVAKFFEALPKTIHELGLVGLGAYNIEQLTALFKNIQPQINSLNLNDNGLGGMPEYEGDLGWGNCSREELSQAFRGIQPTVTTINLGYNSLGEFYASQLTVLLQSIPCTVTSINLEANNLEAFDTNELYYIFSSINRDTTDLNLSGNELLSSTLGDSFQDLPQKLYTLHLNNNKLRSETTRSSFYNVCASIPKSVAQLNLNNNGLGLVDNLSQAIKELSAVKHLNLGNNNLSLLINGPQLAKALSSLSKTVDSLDLSGNELNQYNAYETTRERPVLQPLAIILSKIPDTVAFLNLNGNNLSIVPDTHLAEAFSRLPKGIRSLSLQQNAYRDDYETNNIGPALIHLSKTISTLYLNGYELFTSSPEDRKLSYLGTGLTTLNIGLDSLTVGLITKEFQRKSSLKTINLSISDLYHIKTIELTAAFEALPKSVNTLGVEFSEMEFEPEDNAFTQSLASIPEHIKTLNLNLKLLNKLQLTEIAKHLSMLNHIDTLKIEIEAQDFKVLLSLFQNIPFGLHSLTVRLKEILDKKQLNALFEVMPETVQSVSFKGAQKELTVHVDAFWCAYLVNQVSYHVRKNLFATRQIIPPISISEKLLNRLVALLEQKQTPLALFTCGLLLDGTLINSIEPPYSDQEYMRYMEKRTHDAISFYIKAAEDRFLKPSIDFLLWELKTCSELESVRERLAAYTADPSRTITKYNLFTSKYNPVTSIQNETIVLDPPRPLRDYTVTSSPYIFFWNLKASTELNSTEKDNLPKNFI